MPSGRPSKKGKRTFWLRVYFALGSLIILSVFFFYTDTLVRSSRQEAEVVPELLVRYFSLINNPDNSEDFITQFFVYFSTEFIRDIKYPIIYTTRLDGEEVPQIWKNVGVTEKYHYAYGSLSPEAKIKLQKRLERMPFRLPIRVKGNPSPIGYIYYSESFSMRLLRYMPLLEMMIVLLFVIFGVYSLMVMKRNEKDMLWVGLAKETAHQFGTPLSSLKGWLELMRMRITDGGCDQGMLEIVDQMNVDIEHLKDTANRFGKVGSSINLRPCHLHGIVEETVKYFASRLPHQGQKIDLHFISKIEGKQVELDPDLIRWTLENLIRNSIDAMQGQNGNIIVTATARNGRASVIIRDEGKGIPKSKFKEIFEPGFTTKTRGWGLGLSLAKRIIENYHNGRIRVLGSVPGEGTSIEIALPETQPHHFHKEES
jgi:nitrogen-specific signal transduction histidine kinase